MQACTYVTEAYSPVVCCFFDGVDRNFEKLPSKNLTYALSLLLVACWMLRWQMLKQVGKAALPQYSDFYILTSLEQLLAGLYTKNDSSKCD